MGKNLSKWIACIAAIALSTGCVGTLYSTKYSTKFSNSDIRLGESKSSILLKYGQPYSQEMLQEDGKTTEILCYKESMAYGNTLKTYFYFQDSLLVKKTQVDTAPSEVTLRTKQE